MGELHKLADSKLSCLTAQLEVLLQLPLALIYARRPVEGCNAAQHLLRVTTRQKRVTPLSAPASCACDSGPIMTSSESADRSSSLTFTTYARIRTIFIISGRYSSRYRASSRREQGQRNMLVA